MNVLDPCGQIMDVLRSCPTGKMRFREGDIPVNVKWFFASAGAAVFDGPSIFRIADFESTPFQNNGLGTQYPPRGNWRDGMRPAGFNGRVSCSQFMSPWWTDGIPMDQVLNVPRLPNGLPLCCAPVNTPFMFAGRAKVKRYRLTGPPAGVLFGGTAATSYWVSSGGIEFNGSAHIFTGS